MSEKEISTKQFVVWITAVSTAYEDAILAGMVKKGYIVSVVASNGVVSAPTENCPAVLITFRVDVSIDGVMAKNIHHDVLVLLKMHDALYYSVIVSSLNDACFIGSNMMSGPPINPILPPVPDKSNIN